MTTLYRGWRAYFASGFLFAYAGAAALSFLALPARAQDAATCACPYAYTAPEVPQWKGALFEEPTIDVSGNRLPKTGPKALKGCKVWENGSVDGYWVKPTGKPHALPEPADWHALPWRYEVACCNGPCDAANWGPLGTGTLQAPVLTVP